MPTLRKFFKHFLPRLMGTSANGGSSSYANYANGYGNSGPQRSNTMSRITRNKNRQYSQFGSAEAGDDTISEETEMQRFSGDKKSGSAAVTIGVVSSGDREAQRDDHSERAILQTKSFTVQYD